MGNPSNPHSRRAFGLGGIGAVLVAATALSPVLPWHFGYLGLFLGIVAALVAVGAIGAPTALRPGPHGGPRPPRRAAPVARLARGRRRRDRRRAHRPRGRGAGRGPRCRRRVARRSCRSRTGSPPGSPAGAPAGPKRRLERGGCRADRLGGPDGRYVTRPQRTGSSGASTSSTAPPRPRGCTCSARSPSPRDRA